MTRGIRKARGATQWMPLPVADGFIEHANLSPEQYGCLVRLYKVQWFKGSLPVDPGELARIVGVSNCVWKRSVWPKIKDLFVQVGNVLLSMVVDDERNFAAENCRKKANAANARWGKVSSENSDLFPAPACPLHEDRTTPLPVPQESREERESVDVASCASQPGPTDDLLLLETGKGHTSARVLRFIVAFDSARAAAFGQERARPWAHPQDMITVSRWLAMADEAGISESTLFEICENLFETTHLRMEGKDQEPPAALSFHNVGLKQALKMLKRPIERIDAGIDVPQRGQRPGYNPRSDEAILRAAGVIGRRMPSDLVDVVP